MQTSSPRTSCACAAAKNKSAGTTAIVQALTGLVEDGLSLQGAVDHPRVHVHRAGTPDEEVKVEDPEDLTMYFGGVAATMLTGGGRLVGAADPRRAGAVRVVAR